MKDNVKFFGPKADLDALRVALTTSGFQEVEDVFIKASQDIIPASIAFVMGTGFGMCIKQFLKDRGKRIVTRETHGDRIEINGDFSVDEIERLLKIPYAFDIENDNQTPSQKANMPSNSQQQLTIFISHSAKDEKLATALIALLRSALNIPAEEIRCTSVNGYRLPIGADTEERLRQEVHDAKAFIGLITASSMASAYVMFELGARWGANLHLAPLLGAGASSELLRGPLSSLNALHCEEPAQLHQLISDLANHLTLTNATKPAVYQNLIDDLVAVSKSLGKVNDASGKMETLSTKATVAEKVLAPSDLTCEEMEVIKLFTHEHIRSLSIERIVDHIKIHPIKMERTMRRLIDCGLVTQVVRMGMPFSYRLTAQGQDFLVTNELLPS